MYLTVETSGGCINSSASSPLTINVFENPTASFSINSSTLYLPNDPLICTNTSSGAVAYWWNFGDGYTSAVENPVHNYSNLGSYSVVLIATSLYNCTDTAIMNIGATGDIVFPNAFTPDPTFASGGVYDEHDYTNHVFFPIATGVAEFHLLIFNRWGEIVFESNNIDVGWDGYYRGHLCQEDVYVFKASAVFVDGRKVEKIGDILLLR